jgi:hypothetical protein
MVEWLKQGTLALLLSTLLTAGMFLPFLLFAHCVALVQSSR